MEELCFWGQVFDFADKYRGAYSTSLRSAVCPFYCDFDGYQVLNSLVFHGKLELLIYQWRCFVVFIVWGKLGVNN